jgi:GH24 family phage-related lysozyme (muramidase)
MNRLEFPSERVDDLRAQPPRAALVMLGVVVSALLALVSPFAPRAEAAAAPPLATSPVGIARTPDGGGYWIATSDGSIANYGNAAFYNSLPGLGVRVSNIVGITATPTGRGYWLTGADGGIFAFGDAQYYNSLPGLGVRVSNIVGITATPTGRGYWLTGADGGIFAFGDAQYYKSLGGVHLNAPVVGIVATPSAGGYWLVAKDGGVFSFGDARFLGRPEVVNRPVQTGRALAGNLTLSAAGADFIAAHEGFRATPYNDANGNCTVGFGHLIRLAPCTAADRSVTRATAVSLLQSDTRTFQKTIRDTLPATPLHQHEFDALVDFTYNIGSGAFASSSARSDLAAAPPNYAAVPADFAKWNADRLCGLYRRRIDEGNLFRAASYSLTGVACPAGMR